VAVVTTVLAIEGAVSVNETVTAELDATSASFRPLSRLSVGTPDSFATFATVWGSWSAVWKVATTVDTLLPAASGITRATKTVLVAVYVEG
jgi:hypothetical protein